MRAVLLLLLLPLAATAQPVLVPWGVTVAHTTEAFEADRPGWQTDRVLVERRFARGALNAEAGRSLRFGHADAFLGLDAYRDLGRRAYANARLQVAPDAAAMARTDLLVEVYQGTASGWEFGGGGRYLGYADDDLFLGSASVGHYVGAWYLRARAVVVPKADRTGVSTTLAARYYPDGEAGPLAPLVEFMAGQGQEVVVPVPGAPGELRASLFGNVRGQWFFRAPLGVALGVGYTDDDTLSRWRLDGSLLVRW